MLAGQVMPDCASVCELPSLRTCCLSAPLATEFSYVCVTPLDGLDRIPLDGFPECLSPVSSAAADQQIHPPVVRRQSGRLDDVHALLSSRVVLRLSLCPLVG